MILFKTLISLLSPSCILCGALTNQKPYQICLPCWLDLPILSHHCRRCSRILDVPTETVCGMCLTNPPPFDHTYALFPYEPPVTYLITALKFQKQLSHAQLLGELFAHKMKEVWYKNQSLPDVIIPVPLHRLRLKERGFNQALEIARPINKLLSIPIDWRGSLRMKHTDTQSSLSAKERKKNLENAFCVLNNYTGQSVAVLDDVMTTDHTMTSFCRALKQAGAARIDAWCCARAICKPQK